MNMIDIQILLLIVTMLMAFGGKSRKIMDEKMESGWLKINKKTHQDIEDCLLGSLKNDLTEKWIGTERSSTWEIFV